MRKYCPNCHHFRNMDSYGHPPNCKLTIDVLEDADGCAIYGCFNPAAWKECMPMRVIDIQLLRAVECGSFIERMEDRTGRDGMTTDEITVPLSIISKLCDNLERDETRRWNDIGRSKNDAYINGSHSGYGHALRDIRRLMDYIKFANEACEK